VFMYICYCYKLLEVLWDFAHLPLLKTSLVELALEEHLAILSEPFNIKDQTKKLYAVKCVEDIREVSYVDYHPIAGN
jgi:ubiquitin carboxyl-terminal hydrolase 9/24